MFYDGLDEIEATYDRRGRIVQCLHAVAEFGEVRRGQASHSDVADRIPENHLQMAALFFCAALFAVVAKDLFLVALDGFSQRKALGFRSIDEEAALAVDLHPGQPTCSEVSRRKRFREASPIDELACPVLARPTTYDAIRERLSGCRIYG